MTETNATSEYCGIANNEIAVFQRSIETCDDPGEIARMVKLAFKRMPGEMALACFVKVMTAGLPHPIQVAFEEESRRIIDENGADRLNGKGDFLFRDSTGLHRGQVPYISDEDFESLCAR